MRLEREFFEREDVTAIARELLGCRLTTRISGVTTSGMIVETEAYAGITDRASHAWNGRRTSRTETMYREAGTCYVYLCYGMHHLFNIVTSVVDTPHAVLIRAIEPLEGIPEMLSRRRLSSFDPKISNGPGRAAQALGISKIYNGISLYENVISVDPYQTVHPEHIIASPRVGVAYAGPHAEWPFRFRIAGNSFIGRD